MAVLKTWGGAGLATGGNLSTTSAGTGDTAFDTVSGTLTIAADGVRQPSIGVPDGTGPVSASWNVSSLSWAIRCYVKVSTNAGIFCSGYTGSGAHAAQFDFNGTGNFRFMGLVAGATSVLWTSTAAPAVGTWYRVEATYNGTTGAWTVAYYNGDSTTANDTKSGTEDTGLTLAKLTVGRVGGTSAGLFVDDIAVGDSATMLGPVTGGGGGTPPPTQSSIHYLYNGSTWIPATGKQYTT